MMTKSITAFDNHGCGISPSPNLHTYKYDQSGSYEEYSMTLQSVAHQNKVCYVFLFDIVLVHSNAVYFCNFVREFTVDTVMAHCLPRFLSFMLLAILSTR